MQLKLHTHIINCLINLVFCKKKIQHLIFNTTFGSRKFYSEDWSNDAENSALITEINDRLTDIHIENRSNVIFQIFTVFLIQ